MKLHYSFLIVAASALMLAGAGCGSATTTPTNNTPPTNTNTSPSPSTTPPTSTIPSVPAASSTAGLPPIDATWGTYNNAALKFSFQYPVHGRYAPTWDVSFVNETDPSIQSGCFIEQSNVREASNQITVGNTVFCHSKFEDRATSHAYFTDDYATKIGTRYVVMRFRKDTVVAGPTNCHNVPGDTLLISAASCIPFDQAMWQAQLDQIAGTFKQE